MIELTDHGIVRFQERIVPELSYKDAQTLLENVSKNASKLKEKTLQGHFQWSIIEPPCRLVTKLDKGVHICVTVLHPKMYELPTQEGIDIFSQEELTNKRGLLEQTAAHISERMAIVDAQLHSNPYFVPELYDFNKLKLEEQILQIEAEIVRSELKLLKVQTKLNKKVRLGEIAISLFKGEISMEDAMYRAKDLTDPE